MTDLTEIAEFVRREKEAVSAMPVMTVGDLLSKLNEIVTRNPDMRNLPVNVHDFGESEFNEVHGNPMLVDVDYELPCPELDGLYGTGPFVLFLTNNTEA